jgi:hypothetical protein
VERGIGKDIEVKQIVGRDLVGYDARQLSQSAVDIRCLSGQCGQAIEDESHRVQRGFAYT